MADSGFQTFGRWAAAAICAAGFSLALAQPDGQPHAASVSFRLPDASRPGSGFANSFVHQPAPGPVRVARRDSNSGSSKPSGIAARRRSGQRLSPMPPMAARGIPYRPVSEGARNMPRPPGNTAYMRAGSIRDAVTRYNEERDAGRGGASRPPNAGAHLPDPSLYRN